MILKVKDVLKSFSRIGLYSPPLAVYMKKDISLKYPTACGEELQLGKSSNNQ